MTNISESLKTLLQTSFMNYKEKFFYNSQTVIKKEHRRTYTHLTHAHSYARLYRCPFFCEILHSLVQSVTQPKTYWSIKSLT